MKITQERKWAQLLVTAYQEAENSLDPSTQLGAVIVDTHGKKLAVQCNEFPRGVRGRYGPVVTFGEEGDYTHRWQRPAKYQYIEHAERNAIYAAARRGSALQGASMVCPWAACADCARAIIQAGITQLVVHKQMHEYLDHPQWVESIALAHEMLWEAGVEVLFYDGKLAPSSRSVAGNPFTVRMNGEPFEP